MRCQLSQRSSRVQARPAPTAAPWRPALKLRRASTEVRIAQIDRPADASFERRAESSPGATTAAELERLVEATISEEGGVQTLTDIWRRNAVTYGDKLAVRDPHHEGSPEMTFSQLYEAMQDFAAGLSGLGLQPQDRVALFSENSSRWLVADGAVMAAGGVDVEVNPLHDLRFIVGVMLTHANLCYQVRNLSHFLQVRPGDRVLSLLPPWHIYERTCSYFVLSSGGQQVYTNIRRLRDDLVAHPPDHLVCVPLVLDTLHARVVQKIQAGPRHRAAIATALLAAGAAYALASVLVYRKVREALGVRRTVISGGGSLAAHLDDFYEALGLQVLNGWGLSETAPVLACRRAVEGQNIRGSVGVPTPGTQLRVVDPESLAPLPAGRQGLVLARGPGVMPGYWQDPAASAKAFRAGGGWFDTGDLGWVAPEGVPASNCAGHLVLTGRAKDTLVLSSGKNVEPQPVEDAVAASPLIKFVVLVGQLAALSAAALEDRLMAEVTRLNSGRPDYHPFDHVAHIAVLRTPLSPDDGTLTRTLKPRRAQIAQRYERELTQLLGRLRG
eukprot:XP_001691289.1 long-chain-fatty-acid CoA ligase [Chlamydomonas reinhardtii]